MAARHLPVGRSLELVYDGMKLPPIKAFDKAENVIYIYSFSLSFVPGLSLAFVVADRKLIESLSYLVSVRMTGRLRNYLQNI